MGGLLSETTVQTENSRMKEYTITRPVFIDAGTRLALSDAQARARRGQIKEVGDGVFEATAIVNFKAGEVVGLETVPKAIASAFDEIKTVRRTSGAAKVAAQSVETSAN